MRQSFQLSRGWNPFRDLSQLQHEFHRVVSGFGGPFADMQHDYPTVNLHTSENSVVLTAELPGLDPEKLDVNVTRDTVTLRGEHVEEHVTEGETYHRRERKTGAFSRTITLPCEVDLSATEATYQQGVLRVKLGRPEVQKPHKVSVKVS